MASFNLCNLQLLLRCYLWVAWRGRRDKSPSLQEGIFTQLDSKKAGWAFAHPTNYTLAATNPGNISGVLFKRGIQCFITTQSRC